ncbi:TPA: hypothetical protein ACH3X1_015622 [Trebouxia sp. C0004]
MPFSAGAVPVLEVGTIIEALRQHLGGTHDYALHCPRAAPSAGVNVPTFEFIELPGIQSLPEEDRIQSERLVHSYISDPKALVLCVVEGADAVLDKRNALKVVIDANKLGSTTGALTKSDKVHEDEVEDYSFKCILVKSRPIGNYPSAP